MRARRSRSREAGMTLVEISVAITILSVVVALMYQVIDGTIRGASMAREGLRTPKVANAVLGQIFKDFRYIYWGGLSGDTGFFGKNGTLAGMDADKVSFITARRTRLTGSESDGARASEERTSPLTEVGYACRQNDTDRSGRWIELWRREDYFVDDDPVKGGKYTMVYDKIRKFNLRYYPTPDKSQQSEGLEEWDSRLKHGLPYAVLMEIELDVGDPEREGGDVEEPYPIVRIILLRGAFGVRWTAEQPGSPQPGG